MNNGIQNHMEKDQIFLSDVQYYYKRWHFEEMFQIKDIHCLYDIFCRHYGWGKCLSKNDHDYIIDKIHEYWKANKQQSIEICDEIINTLEKYAIDDSVKEEIITVKATTKEIDKLVRDAIFDKISTLQQNTTSFIKLDENSVIKAKEWIELLYSEGIEFSKIDKWLVWMSNDGQVNIVWINMVGDEIQAKTNLGSDFIELHTKNTTNIGEGSNTSFPIRYPNNFTEYWEWLVESEEIKDEKPIFYLVDVKKKIIDLLLKVADWNRPKDQSIINACFWLNMIYYKGIYFTKNITYLVNADEEGDVSIEIWNNDKKISVVIDDNEDINIYEVNSKGDILKSICCSYKNIDVFKETWDWLLGIKNEEIAVKGNYIVDDEEITKTNEYVENSEKTPLDLNAVAFELKAIKTNLSFYFDEFLYLKYGKKVEIPTVLLSYLDNEIDDLSEIIKEIEEYSG